MRILIIDDDPASRQLLATMLGTHGACDAADSGALAVQMVAAIHQGRPYDLITLELRMPGMEGMRALTAIRAREVAQRIPPPRRSRIIITSGVEAGCDELAALRSRCDGYLLKPIDREQLLDYLAMLALIPERVGA